MLPPRADDSRPVIAVTLPELGIWNRQRNTARQASYKTDIHATRHATHGPADRPSVDAEQHRARSAAAVAAAETLSTVAASRHKPFCPYRLFVQPDHGLQCHFCPSPRVQEGLAVPADPFLLSPLGAHIPYYLSCPATPVAPASPVHATNHKHL